MPSQPADVDVLLCAGEADVVIELVGVDGLQYVRTCSTLYYDVDSTPGTQA